MPDTIYYKTGLDVRAQVLSVHDRRNGVGQPVFGLAPVGHEQTFSLIAPDWCEPHITDDMLLQLVNEASYLAQNRRRSSLVFLFGGSCMLHFVFADANLNMYTCFGKRNHSNPVQPSERHRDLYAANRHLARNM